MRQRRVRLPAQAVHVHPPQIGHSQGIASVGFPGEQIERRSKIRRAVPTALHQLTGGAVLGRPPGMGSDLTCIGRFVRGFAIRPT